MYHNQYYQNYSTDFSSVAPAGGVVIMGVAGALLAGSMAAAREIRKVKAGEEDCSQAVSVVAKEGLGGGLALAAGAAVGKTMFRSGGLGLLAMVAVGVGVKYAYDSFSSGKCRAEADVVAPTPKTTKSK